MGQFLHIRIIKVWQSSLHILYDLAPALACKYADYFFLLFGSYSLSESPLHLPLRPIFRRLHANWISVRSTYAS